MTQTEVAESNEAPQQGAAEEEHAQTGESLDDLLKEYDTPIKEPEKAPEAPAPDPELEALKAYVANQRIKDQNEGLQEASKVLRETVGQDLPDKLFTGVLYEKASKDPRIEQAFTQRFQEPEKWKTILNGIAKELKEDLSIDRPSTESWNAVEASVRSSSTSTPKEEPEITEKDLRGMSDADFQELKKKIGIGR